MSKRSKNPFTLKQQDCIYICKRRGAAGMSCYYCIYRDSKICNNLKKSYEVEKPRQLIIY